MQDQSDAQLLSKYAESRSEAAFREIVVRHTDLVYSSALRQVASPDLACDVAQSVFTDLSRKAPSLAGTLTGNSALLGWLYRSTRYAALNLLRDNRRRQARERQVMEYFNPVAETTPDWENIRPMLDEAISALDDTDRAAVLLRYFENKSLREVGATLGTSDDTAQKRVSRAVERLREFFAKRGIVVGTSGLVVLISTNAVQAAPFGLAATISAAAILAGTTLATTTTATAIKAIAMTTLQKTLITAAIVAAVGTGIYEARHASTLRTQIQNLQRQQTPMADRVEQSNQENNGETTWLKVQNDALIRENTRLKASLAANKAENWKLNATMEGNRAEQKQLADMQVFQDSLTRALLKALGEGGTNLPGSLTEGLARLASVMKSFDTLSQKYPKGRPSEGPAQDQYDEDLNNLMEQFAPFAADKHIEEALHSSDPAVVARSQLWLIAGTLNLDASQIQQVDQILLQNYRDAFAQGLNWGGSSQPASGLQVDDHARGDFSARVYDQIKGVMNPQQQNSFNRMFLSDFMFAPKIMVRIPNGSGG